MGQGTCLLHDTLGGGDGHFLMCQFTATESLR